MASLDLPVKDASSNEGAFFIPLNRFIPKPVTDALETNLGGSIEIYPLEIIEPEPVAEKKFTETEKKSKKSLKNRIFPFTFTLKYSIILYSSKE